uniref:Gustatory receptor n=1 Tax=Anopheles maculatus TaxID=74869 RepID=A0A182SCM9_9DIPT
MDAAGLVNSRTYTVRWWPNVNDHIQSLSPVWNTSKIFGSYTIPFNPPTDKPTILELFSATALTVLRIYMIYVIFTTEAWDLMFTSSSPLVQDGLDILLKIPIAMVVFIPWIILVRKPQIARLSYDLTVFDKQMTMCNYQHNYQLFHIIGTIFAAIDILIPLTILAAIRGFHFWIDHFIVLAFVGFSWSIGLLFNTTFNILLFHIMYRIEVVNDLLSYCLMPISTIWMAGDIKKRTVVTWKLIHRIINITDVMEIEDLLQQFSEQMNHRSPSIDFRFFDVDWPLLVQ